MYTIFYSRESIRFLRKISSSLAKKICSKLEKVAQNPYAKNNNIKPLKKSEANYRLRIGDFRALYILNNNEKKITVVNINSRGEIYRI